MLRITLHIVAGVALLATIVPAVLNLSGDLDRISMDRIMLCGTFVWFSVNLLKMKFHSVSVKQNRSTKQHG